MGADGGMRRRQDWPERLNNYLAEIRRQEFAWGSLDCCLLAANIVNAMTDEDPGWWFRGTYSNALGAVKQLRIFSGGGVVETMEKMAATYGWPEISVLRAQRGDPMLITGVVPETAGTALDLAIGVCIGHRAVVMSDKGLAAVPIKRATRAWRV